MNARIASLQGAFARQERERQGDRRLWDAVSAGSICQMTKKQLRYCLEQYESFFFYWGKPYTLTWKHKGLGLYLVERKEWTE